MQALKYEVILGNTLGGSVVRILFKSCNTHGEFCLQGTKMSKERDVRMKDGLKKKEMSRQKVSKETSLTERGLKIKV